MESQLGVEKEKLFGILGEINYKIKEYLGRGGGGEKIRYLQCTTAVCSSVPLVFLLPSVKII